MSKELIDWQRILPLSRLMQLPWVYAWSAKDTVPYGLLWMVAPADSSRASTAMAETFDGRGNYPHGTKEVTKMEERKKSEQKDQEPAWINKAFVSVRGEPGVAFEGTIDECIEWCVGKVNVRIHYLHAVKTGLGLKSL